MHDAIYLPIIRETEGKEHAKCPYLSNWVSQKRKREEKRSEVHAKYAEGTHLCYSFYNLKQQIFV